MNESIIMGMINPYLKENELTYHEFEQIFSMLSMKEQYAVLEIIIKNNIDLVEKHNTSGDIEDFIEDNQDAEEDEFELLYDLEVFSDDNGEDLPVMEEVNEREYLKIRKNILLSNRTLIKMIQEGDAQAKQDICIKNHGLVDKWVNYYNRFYGNKLEFEDLEQAGMLGMIKAAEKFDLDMGTEFSTYAVWWIKQAITREIMDSGYTIRIPVHKMEQILKVLRYDSQFAWETDYYKRLKMISKESKMPIILVEDCLRLYYQFINTTSLDLPIGEEEDTTLGEMIPYESQKSVEDTVGLIVLKEWIKVILTDLSEREQDVLRMRYGLFGERARTLEEVGNEFGVTRERIRQIEAKALRKLKRKNIRLKDFLA